MMPQKKNPGTLELLRGRSGRINGMVAAALTLMKVCVQRASHIDIPKLAPTSIYKLCVCVREG